MDVLRLLHDHGADLHSPTGPHGYGPIHEASAHGHTEVVKYMMQIGAPATARSLLRGFPFDTPFTLAVRQDRLDAFNLLLPLSKSEEVQHAAGAAARHASANVLDILLKNGLNGNVEHGRRVPPLLREAAHGQTPNSGDRAVRILLDHGADLHASHASKEDGATICPRLIDEGLDPNQAAGTGRFRTPLAIALMNNHVGFAKMLLHRGAKLEKYRSLGRGYPGPTLVQVQPELQTL